MAHLLDTYAIATQSKIGEPHILEKYYPLPFNKYIVFAPISKLAKCYSYYQDVLDILLPILNKNDIQVIQVGAAGEPGFNGCYQLQGRTTLTQVYYLIKRSLLYFGADTYASHFSSASATPSVVLISNNFSSNVRGYWNRDKQIVLEPDRTKRKPSFSLDEPFPKQINEIKIEDVAAAVCKQLNIPLDFPYETVYVGETYNNKILEAIPCGVTRIDNLGTDSVAIRMDYEFNEQILQFQMQHCPVVIVTDQPINLEILKNYKPRIKLIFYIIKENHNIAFAEGIKKLNIPLQMFSYLPEEELNKFKLEYLDIGTILPKNIKTKENIKELKDIPPDQLHYKSCKHSLMSGKVYSSRAAQLKDQPVTFINQITPIIDNEEWWREIEYFMVFRKK